MTPNKEEYSPSFLPDLLPIYYKRLFPYSLYYRWLSYGGYPKTYMSNREFSFTLKDDIYIRYQSFCDQNDMQAEIQRMCPYKIDIGAVFSCKPKDRKIVKQAEFQAQEKELVFDIDMTDYDDVRNCCSEANICHKCWPLMVIAVKIIDRALRDDFGFQHLLWIYSGRRGVHCWVADEEARKLSQTGRTAIAEYLSIVKGGENQNKKVTLYEKRMHPFVSRSLDIIRQYFLNYACKGQDFLGTDDRVQKVFSLIPDEKLCESLLKIVNGPKATTSRLRWEVIKSGLEESFSKCADEIMLQYCYPRLDVNVSKGVNHLLKSPFSIHPKTGRVCVPIDPEQVDQFDPFTVPRINDICDELNNVSDTNEDENIETRKYANDYKKTSLKVPIQLFERFVKKLEASNRSKILEERDKQMEF